MLCKILHIDFMITVKDQAHTKGLGVMFTLLTTKGALDISPDLMEEVLLGNIYGLLRD